MTKTAPRYAIYLVPDPGSPLDAFGRDWLGRDHSGFTERKFKVAELTPRRLTALTEGPRQFGLHCTLKPPFALNESSTLGSLLASAQLLAQGLKPIDIPALELGIVGKFIALLPTTSSASLEMLAASCVRAFEGFRMPLTAAEEDAYHKNRLTVHQEQMLEHWGYPYVMEEFRFHMTLTDPIPDERERNAVLEALRDHAAPILSKPIPLRSLTVVSSSDMTAPMTALATFPFGHKS
jgi:hypothetical protein